MKVDRAYSVHMVRQLTGSSLMLPVAASNSFNAIKTAQSLLDGWTPVRVKRLVKEVKKEENDEE